MSPQQVAMNPVRLSRGMPLQMMGDQPLSITQLLQVMAKAVLALVQHAISVV
jgi:hypothetical protein